MSAGMSTVNTVLKVGSTAAGVAQVGKIKSYPNLGNSPESLDTTDLEDSMSTSAPGVQQLDSMEFTMNYDKTVYESYKANDYIASGSTELYYQLEFGTNGADGKFSWKGRHAIAISEGSVNGIREMTLSVFPTTIIHASDASTAFPTSGS